MMLDLIKTVAQLMLMSAIAGLCLRGDIWAVLQAWAKRGVA